MRTDGLFTVHHHTVTVDLDQPFYLCPISDIHRDNELHAAAEWQAWLKYAQRERRSNAVFLALGDSLDFARAHVRAVMDSAGGEGENIKKTVQHNVEQWIEVITEELRPLRKQFIGWMSGNHYFELSDTHKGVTTKTHSDKQIADILGCEYLGTMAGITITLRDKAGTGQAEVKIIAHHGAGGATTIGGSLNRVQRMLRGWAVDIALMGDDHKRGIVPVGSILSLSRHNNRDIITDKIQLVGRTGSFLCGFEPGKSSYVVDAAYEPTSIGTIEIEMRLVKCPRTGKLIVKLRSIC